MLKNRKRVAVVAGLVLLLGGGSVWYFASGSSQVEQVRQLRDQLFSEKSKDMSPEQRKESFGQFRKEMEKLSPKDRSEVFADGRKKMEQKLDKFFKSSPEQQAEELDKDIDNILEKGKRWLEGGGKGGGGGFPFFGGGGGGPGPGGPGGPGGAAPGSANATSGGAQAASGGAGASGPPGGGFGRGRSQEQRDQFRKNMLDSTSPEFRAQMSEYRRQFGNRMQERGVSFGGFGGGR